jgi:hypothetical protein
VASSQATADVFLTAFRTLAKKQQQAVLAGIAEDEELREDLLDLAVLAKRRRQASRPFREYLGEKDR